MLNKPSTAGGEGQGRLVSAHKEAFWSYLRSGMIIALLITTPLALVDIASKDSDPGFLVVFMIIAMLLWTALTHHLYKTYIYTTRISTPAVHRQMRQYLELAWGDMHAVRITKRWFTKYYVIRSNTVEPIHYKQRDVYELYIPYHLTDKQTFIRNVLSLAPPENPLRLFLEAELKSAQHTTRISQ